MYNKHNTEDLITNDPILALIDISSFCSIEIIFSSHCNRLTLDSAYGSSTFNFSSPSIGKEKYSCRMMLRPKKRKRPGPCVI